MTSYEAVEYLDRHFDAFHAEEPIMGRSLWWVKVDCLVVDLPPPDDEFVHNVSDDVFNRKLKAFPKMAVLDRDIYPRDGIHRLLKTVHARLELSRMMYEDVTCTQRIHIYSTSEDELALFLLAMGA